MEIHTQELLDEELEFERKYLRKKKNQLRKIEKSIKILSSRKKKNKIYRTATPKMTLKLSNMIHDKYQNKAFVASVIHLTEERIKLLKKIKSPLVLLDSKISKMNQRVITQEAA